jgi:hypothetical protein
MLVWGSRPARGRREAIWPLSSQGLTLAALPPDGFARCWDGRVAAERLR